MSTPTPTSDRPFTCDCQESMRSACAGGPLPGSHEGKQYCVLHFPGDKPKFWDALEKKLSQGDFNFGGAWFPSSSSFEHVQFTSDANFNSAHFEGEVDFEGATFSRNADFSKATFRDAYFCGVAFNAGANFSGTTFRSYVQFIDTTFTAEACFQSAKFAAMAAFNRAAFAGKVDFRNATFGQEAPFDCADFSRAKFRARVEFGSVKFASTANFREAAFEGVVDLSNCVFNGEADFSSSVFDSVTFMHSAFNSSANFSSATFRGLTSFYKSSFSAELDFGAAIFHAVASFNHAVFRDYVKFIGCEDGPTFSSTSSLDLQFAKVEHADRVSFQTLKLRPHWFVNVDATKFDFVDVDWSNVFPRGSERNVSRRIHGEIDRLEAKKIGSPYRLLSVACRRLAINAEENHRYDEASEFRYWSMDALRQDTKRNNHDSSGKLHWWLYYLASGYGEQIGRAIVVLFGIWAVFAVAYLATGHVKVPGSHAWQDYAKGIIAAFNYSLQVITLQRPDRPTGFLTPMLVGLETILGPLQAALLALAIRRKFMR